MDQVHLSEWTFDRKRISANSNPSLNPNPNAQKVFGKVAENVFLLTLILTLMHKKVFGKAK